MPVDHPDGTFPVAMIMADIMMPVDIQAQYVTLTVDIAAQTLSELNINIAAQTLSQLNVNIAASAITLNVNIASQTANINVNIAASAITLNVNIASQTANINVNIAASAITMNVAVTGTANISINAQTVGVYLQPEWAAKTGIDKNLYIYVGSALYGYGIIGSYTVPAGKTLYICGLCFECYASNAVNANKAQIGRAYLRNYTDAIALAEIGGDGGGGIVFSKPLRIAAGKRLDYAVYCHSIDSCNLSVSTWGYEV